MAAGTSAPSAAHSPTRGRPRGSVRAGGRRVIIVLEAAWAGWRPQTHPAGLR